MNSGMSCRRRLSTAPSTGTPALAKNPSRAARCRAWCCAAWITSTVVSTAVPSVAVSGASSTAGASMITQPVAPPDRPRSRAGVGAWNSCAVLARHRIARSARAGSALHGDQDVRRQPRRAGQSRRPGRAGHAEEQADPGRRAFAVDEQHALRRVLRQDARERRGHRRRALAPAPRPRTGRRAWRGRAARSQLKRRPDNSRWKSPGNPGQRVAGGRLRRERARRLVGDRAAPPARAARGRGHAAGPRRRLGARARRRVGAASTARAERLGLRPPSCSGLHECGSSLLRGAGPGCGLRAVRSLCSVRVARTGSSRASSVSRGLLSVASRPSMKNARPRPTIRLKIGASAEAHVVALVLGVRAAGRRQQVDRPVGRGRLRDLRLGGRFRQLGVVLLQRRDPAVSISDMRAVRAGTPAQARRPRTWRAASGPPGLLSAAPRTRRGGCGPHLACRASTHLVDWLSICCSSRDCGT